MMSDYEISDYNGNLIAVGTRVRVWDYKEGHPDWGQHLKYFGVVTEIDDFDHDVDDDTGRSIQVEPWVHVKFDDGSTEHYTTGEWEFEGSSYDREPVRGKVEELTAVI